MAEQEGPSQKDLDKFEKIGKEALNKDIDKDDLDLIQERLGNEPAFYAYFAEMAGDKNVAKYIAENQTPEEMIKSVELFDTKIKPIVERTSAFLDDQFFKKMKLFRGSDALKNARDSVESYLGKEAAENSEAFVGKYTDLFDQYDKLNEQADKLEDYLMETYGTTDYAEINEQVAELNQHTAEIKEGIRATGEQYRKETKELRNNGWNKLKMKLISKLQPSEEARERASAQLEGGDQAQYRAVTREEVKAEKKHNAYLETARAEIDQLQKVKKEININVGQYEDTLSKLDSKRQEIINSIPQLGDLKKLLNEQAKDIIAGKEDYNIDDASDSLKEINNLNYEGENKGQIEKEMKEMLKEVYRRQIKESSEAKELTIDSGKVRKFQKFLEKVGGDSQSLEVLTEVLDEEIRNISEADKKSPKAAQLGIMKKYVQIEQGSK